MNKWYFGVQFCITLCSINRDLTWTPWRVRQPKSLEHASHSFETDPEPDYKAVKEIDEEGSKQN